MDHRGGRGVDAAPPCAREARPAVPTAPRRRAWPALAAILTGLGAVHGATIDAAPQADSALRFAASGARSEHYRSVASWLPAMTGLREPLDISVGSDGQVYVLDAFDERVVVLDSAGTPVWQWHDTDPPDDGQWEDEGPIAALGTPDGELLVLRRLGRIQRDSVDDRRQLSRYRRDGTARWRARPLGVDTALDISHPDRIWFDRFALTPDGEKVFVLDRGAPRVSAKFARDGRNAGVENLPPASRTRLSDTFDWYTDIGVLADGRLALLNQARSQLLLRRSQWTPRGAPTNRAVSLAGRPTRLTTDASGHVFVLDASGWVRKLDAAGRTIATFDGRGDGPSTRSSVVDIAAAPDGAVLTIDGWTGAVHRFESVPGPGAVRPPADLYCDLTPAKTAHPGRVRLGQPVTVTLSLSGRCPPSEGSDIVLLLSRGVGDGSRSMELAVSRPFARAFIQRADLEHDKIGIASHTVTFTPTVDAALGRDRAALLASLDGISPDRLDGPYGARQHVYAYAQAMFDGPDGRAAARKIVVAFTTVGQPGISVLDSLRVRSRGTRIVSVLALEKEVPLHLYWRDESLLWPRFLASGWWDYIPAGGAEPAAGAALYDALSADVPRAAATHLAATVVVTDRVPVDMTYIAGSARPEAEWDPATRVLTWHLADVPFGGADLAYRLRPMLAGMRPTNVDARAAFVDGLGVEGTLWFPVPEVEVMAPSATPSPTATLTSTPTPSRTSTAPPSSTPTTTPSATASPTPTATSVPVRRYIPVALREGCASDERSIDVILAIDTSTSMDALGADGRPKLVAAVAATRAFLDAMRLDQGDRAAVVVFNAVATLRAPLTSERASLETALDGLDTAPHTCLPCAVETAWAELQSPRHAPENLAVILLLTDGRSNPRPVGEAVARAAEAKAGGARVVTIGLGSDLDFESLRQIASRPDDFHNTPDAAALAGIYRRIALDIRCPSDRFWGRR